jgi:hypothetical protein
LFATGGVFIFFDTREREEKQKEKFAAQEKANSQQETSNEPI